MSDRINKYEYNLRRLGYVVYFYYFTRILINIIFLLKYFTYFQPIRPLGILILFDICIFITNNTFS